MTLSPDGAFGRRWLLAGAATALTGPALATPKRPAHARHVATAALPGAAPAPADDTGSDLPSSAGPANTPLGPVDTLARAGCIIDFSTGATLLDKQADIPVVPSSLTKLMTAYLVFAALAGGKLTLTQALPVSEKAWRMGGSKMFVPFPGQVAVQDLIRGMITQSGNDACIVLAEGINGSEQQFVDGMNQAAAKLGLGHSVFRNSTGWPDPAHRMSPRDIALLAHHLITDYPQYYHFFGERDYKFNNIEQGNRNILVERGIADGLKTGHTQEGGFSECASADRGGRRIIIVLTGMSSMRERARESERMLEWAFANFENVRLLAAGQPIDRVPVWLGRAPDVSLIGGQDCLVTLPRGWKAHAKIEIRFDAPIAAPVRKGDRLGQMLISGGPMPDLALPLVAGDSVARLPLPARAMKVLSHYVTGV